GFGVSTADEGRELRALGVTRRVLVFTPVLPLDFAALRAASLTPCLGDPSVIQAWRESGGGEWHLSIDTGMHRAGVRWDRIADVADAVRAAPPAGALTHFHSSENDDGTLEVQEQRFRDALDALPVRPVLLHADNSGAIVRRSPSAWSFVRPGVFLYGVGSGPKAAMQPEAVAHLRARVVEVHALEAGESVSYGATWMAAAPARIATVNAGYADGYARSLGNAGTALLHGERVPVRGTVTMDMTMVDVTGVPCAPGDVVTLLGRDGSRTITAEELAVECGLSPYELLTGLRMRLPRVYA
ncbi:MAG: alanine racemase, partial [Gemmatimonadetes bacterium]|nr:alanine racemase [Gemmatimonadota bacterium]